MPKHAKEVKEVIVIRLYPTQYIIDNDDKDSLATIYKFDGNNHQMKIFQDSGDTIIVDVLSRKNNEIVKKIIANTKKYLITIDVVLE